MRTHGYAAATRGRAAETSVLVLGAALLSCATRTSTVARRAAATQSQIQPSAAAPTRPPALAPPTRAVAVTGAALAVAHPNEARDPADLGARVAPRALHMPRVAPGQAATFSLEGGRHAWVAQLTGATVLTSVAYAHGNVYLGAGFESTSVYALDAQTGRLRWTSETPDGGPTAAIVEGDKVLFNTESCTLFAFDLRTGRLRWSHYLGDPLMSQAAAADGRVFSAYPDESAGGFSFAAMSMRDGHYLWQRGLRGDVITAPVLAGDSVYASTMDGSVYRFVAATGRRVWVRALGATSAPSVDGERVYVSQRAAGGRERQLVLASATGMTESSGDAVRAPYAAQRPDTGGTPAGWGYEGSRPAFAEGRLYYAMGQDLVARDAGSGHEVWRRRYPHASSARGMTSPAVVGSELVVGTREGDLFGMDIDTGATTWAYHVGEPIAFQPTVANGWVYATTTRGKVIGLQVADASFDGWHMWGGNARHNGLSAHETVAPAAAAAVEDRPSQGTLRPLAPGQNALPLMHTSVTGEVTGYVARVTVEQTFSNPYTRPIDAEYLFPLPADSAVDSLELHVGDRVVRGEIQRREEARGTFRAARARGQTAALLEQDRPNLFRQSVANIRPGESVRVALRFAETVPYRDGRYEFAFPLATGSRYTPGAGGTTPTRPPGDVDLALTLDVGIAVDHVESPSHALTVAHEDGTRQRVTLAAGAALPDRDFVLRYHPVATAPEPSVFAERHGSDGFFTLMVHPDAHAPDAAITPRELVFVVDTSSSMRDAPLAQAQALLDRALGHLRPGDTFRVLRFADGVSALALEALTPTDENIARARAYVSGLRAAGATEMLPGMLAALHGAQDPSRVRLVVLLTDGYIGNERDIFASVERELGTSRVFAFGVGTAVNRYLLETLAEVGRGVAEIVAPSEDASTAADRFYAHIDRPYLTDVQVDFGGLDVSGVYPRVVPDLFADRPLLVTGRYARAGEGDVRITGRIRGEAFTRVVHVALPAVAQDHEALPSLWARARIHDLSRAMLLGETESLRAEVTDLGLHFGLVTDYTSLVAVDEAPASAARAHIPLSPGHGGGAATATIPTAVDRPMPASPAAGIVGSQRTPMMRPAGSASGFGDDSPTYAHRATGAPVAHAGFTVMAPAATAATAAPAPVRAPSPSANAGGERGRRDLPMESSLEELPARDTATPSRPGASIESSPLGVTLGAPSVDGPLAATSARATALRSLGALRAAYASARANHPGLRGRVVLRVVVAGDTGRVTEAALDEDPIASPELRAALLAQARAWVFAPTAAGASTTVRFAFLFGL